MERKRCLEERAIDSPETCPLAKRCPHSLYPASSHAADEFCGSLKAMLDGVPRAIPESVPVRLVKGRGPQPHRTVWPAAGRV